MHSYLPISYLSILHSVQQHVSRHRFDFERKSQVCPSRASGKSLVSGDPALRQRSVRAHGTAAVGTGLVGRESGAAARGDSMFHGPPPRVASRPCSKQQAPWCCEVSVK